MDPIRKPTIPVKPVAPSNESVLKAFAMLEKYLRAKKVTGKEFLAKMAAIFESLKNGGSLFPALITFLKHTSKIVGVSDSGSSASTNTSTSTANSNHEYVEMGDGLKWATCNLGASKPEEVGDYIAWGEVEPFYSSYDPLVWKEGCGYYGYEHNRLYIYDIREGSSFRILKYNSSDGKTVLEPADDAASVNWGGAWRTPTEEEWIALLDENKFTWTPEEKNGVKGFTVTSKVQGYVGNSIFLPAGGYFVGEAPMGKFLKGRGHYWSSSKPDTHDDGMFARALTFLTDNPSHGMQAWGAYNGIPVRPVCK